jgi:hypothetical protein
MLGADVPSAGPQPSFGRVSKGCRQLPLYTFSTESTDEISSLLRQRVGKGGSGSLWTIDVFAKPSAKAQNAS